MDASQRELRMLIMESWGRHAMSQGELHKELSRRFPTLASEVREPIQWVERNIKLWYQLLAASAVLPGLRGVLKPFAHALFSGAAYKKREWATQLSGPALMGRTTWQNNEQRVFKATIEVASRGRMPKTEQIASQAGLSIYTIRKFGKPSEILLGAVEDLMLRLPK